MAVRVIFHAVLSLSAPLVIFAPIQLGIVAPILVMVGYKQTLKVRLLLRPKGTIHLFM